MRDRTRYVADSRSSTDVLDAPTAPGRDADDGTPFCAHCQELAQLRRDLHDEIGSALVGIRMQLEAAQYGLAELSDELCRMLNRTMADVSAVVEQVRCLCSVRSDTAIRQTDLGAGLRSIVDRMNSVLHGRLRVELDAEAALDELPPPVASAALMIAREALTNVLKHSEGDWCRISVERTRDRLLLQVVDNGRGWSKVVAGSGCGLGNMRARARELNGECLTGPGAPSGFVVAAWLPMDDVDSETCR
jgi:signal transduction histidine kinase